MLAGMVVVLGAGLVLLRRRVSGGKGAMTLAVIWSLVAGIAGVVLAFLWIFTDHLYSYRNENLLQLNPVSLILCVLLVRAIWKRWRAGPAASASSLRQALLVAIVVAVLSVAGFVLQALPHLDQVNGAIIALAMPLHLGVVALLLALDPRPAARPTA
jgi:hypothetical protein